MKSTKASTVNGDVLVVEDSPTQQEQIRHLLENHGFSVRTASTGKEALDQMRKHQPALVISDIVMPQMDGYALCGEMKSDASLKDIPVILLTSLSGPEDIVKGLQCGADNFIKKPFDERYLLSRVEYILVNRKLRKSDKLQMGVELYLGGHKHFITAERQQILDLLISTYDQAVRLNEELKSREKEIDRANNILRGLYQIAKRLNQATTERELAEQVLDRALELPGFKAGWIPLAEGEVDFRIAAVRGVPPDLVKAGVLDGMCLCRRKLLSGELQRTTVIPDCERLAKMDGDAFGQHSHVSIPLLINDRAIGIMNLVVSDQLTFGEGDIQTFNGIGNQIGVALERVRMREHLEQLVQERTAALTAEITERKRAEEALRESELRFRSVWEKGTDGMRITNEKGTVLLANDAYCKMVEKSREEIEGKPMSIVYEEAAQAKTLRSLQERFRFRNVPTSLEREIVLWNGKRMSFELSNTFLEIPPQPILLLSVLRDITERKRAEDALIESESKYRLLAESSPEMIFVVNREDSLTYVNEAVALQFRSNAPDLIGKHLSEIFPPDLAEQNIRDLRAIFDSKKSMSRETLQKFPIGDIWTETRLSPMFDQKGDVVAVMGLSIDITERKKAEERQLLLTTALESTANGVAITDVKGNIVWVNNAFAKMTGHSWTEVMGQNPRILKSGRQEDSFYRDLWETISAGNVWMGELINRKKDGSLYSEEMTITPMKKGNGEIAHFIAVKQDVSERKRAAVELKRRKEFLEAIMESSMEVILTVANDGKLAFSNSKITSVLGYSIEDIKGRLFMEFVPDEYREEVSGRWAKLLQGASGTYELQIIRKDGTLADCLISYSPVQGFDENLVLVKDISNRKAAEEALRKSEEKYKSLFDRNLAGTFVSTSEGKVLDCNPAYLQMFGFDSYEQAIGTNRNLLYSDQRDRERMLAMLQNQKKVENLQLRMVRIDGTPMYVIANVVGKFDEHDQLVQKTGYLIDDTKRHRLEKELIQSQKLESLGILAGGIAHDFNNILGILMGHVSLLDRIQDNPELHRTSLDAIDKALKRGASLVRQLLTFARKTDVAFEPVLVNDIIKELLRLLRETFPKTIEIVTELSPQLPAIVADGGQIHQVLLNLCVNARDAMPAGGKLRIQTNVVDGDLVRQRFPNALSDKYVAIEVRDSGTGMDEATKIRIFEPFFTTKESGKGTGLGLAVVFGIVQTHRGYIDVESAIGAGSAFRVYLPMEVLQPAMPNNRKVGFEESLGGHETILFVEDEPLLFETSKIALVSKGYRVLYAKDGFEAIEVYRQHFAEIHLVLTDMDLPKLGGERLVKALLEINPKLKIIFASGYVEPEVKAKVLESGAKAFLAKPYEAVAMLTKVREVLDAKG